MYFACRFVSFLTRFYSAKILSPASFECLCEFGRPLSSLSIVASVMSKQDGNKYISFLEIIT